MKGLSPLLKEFKKIVEDNNINKLAFAGVPGFCQPFAELFAYTVKEKESYFIPYTNIEKAKKLVLKEDVGFQMEDYDGNLNIDCLVIFGGLAMPKIGVKEEEVKELINKLKPKYVVGICFMSVFKKANWSIEFDYLIDIYVEYKIVS
ncbi:DUF2124 family protein [Methanocaldococcus sp.]